MFGVVVSRMDEAWGNAALAASELFDLAQSRAFSAVGIGFWGIEEVEMKYNSTKP